VRESLPSPINADALIPTATALVWSVKMLDTDDVDRLLDEVASKAGTPGLRTLAIVLAAMVPDDESPADMLAWLSDADGYQRLREDGFSMRDALNAIKYREGRD